MHYFIARFASLVFALLFASIAFASMIASTNLPCGAATKDATGPRVQVIMNERLGLIYFIHYLAQHQEPNQNGNAFRLFSEFITLHPLTSTETNLLNRFKSIGANSTADWKKFQELEYAAVAAHSQTRLLADLPTDWTVDDRLTMKQCLNHFEPLYQEFVWHRLQQAATTRKKEMQNLCRSSQISKRLHCVKHLCQSDFPDSKMLTIAMVMVPDEKNDALGRDAHCDGQLSIVECMPQHQGKDELSTVFHEMCHSLWMDRSEQTTQTLKKSFYDAKGEKAYEYLAEGLPTALGAGWFSKLATGSIAKYWYSDKTIKGYAEVLLPLCEEYLAQGRTMDENFARQATQLFRGLEPKGVTPVPTKSAKDASAMYM